MLRQITAIHNIRSVGEATGSFCTEHKTRIGCLSSALQYGKTLLTGIVLVPSMEHSSLRKELRAREIFGLREARVFRTILLRDK